MSDMMRGPSLPSVHAAGAASKVVEWALGGDHLDGDEFRRLGVFLEQACGGGLERIRRRQDVFDGELTRVRGLVPHWRGSHGGDFIGGFEGRVAEVRGVEPAIGGAYVALGELAMSARELAREIDELEALQRCRVAAAADTLGQIANRGLVNVGDLVGIVSDPDAQRSRDAIDAANRAREEADSRREELLRRWNRACELAAAALARAIDTAGAARVEPPGALRRHPEASYHPDAVKEDLQRRWARVVERELHGHAGDLGALGTLWQRLSKDERRALMTVRPDLVADHFWPVLTADERGDFSDFNVYATGEHGLEVKAGVTVPLRVVELDIERTLTARATFNSDDSVDVYLAQSGHGAIGLGPKGKEGVTFWGGFEGRVGVMIRFTTRSEYEAAMRRLEAAVRSDLDRRRVLFDETRAVLTDVFGAAEQGFEAAGGVRRGFEIEAAQGFLPLLAEATIVNGAYVDTAESELGVYLTGTVEGRVGLVTGRLDFDGRLFVQDADRCYAALTFTGDAAHSAPILERTGLTSTQLENLGIGRGASGRLSFTITTEATSANRLAMLRLIEDLDHGRLPAESLAGLAAGSEITVAVSRGTSQHEGIPTNPVAVAESRLTEMTTIRSFRKTPDGNYYEQTHR